MANKIIKYDQYLIIKEKANKGQRVLLIFI